MKAKIIFGTEIGTTEYVAQVIKKLLEKQQWEVEVENIRVHKNKISLSGYDWLIFGSPTYNDGQLVGSMRQFVETFEGQLPSAKIAIFGLGDSGYPHFCTAADLLQTWAEAHQGTVSVPLLRIDGYPKKIDDIQAWVNAISSS